MCRIKARIGERCAGDAHWFFFQITPHHLSDSTNWRDSQASIDEKFTRRFYALLADWLSSALIIVDNVPMPHTHFGVPVYFVVSRVEAAPTCTGTTVLNMDTEARFSREC